MKTVSKYCIPRKLTSEESALIKTPVKTRQSVRRAMFGYALANMPRQEERESPVAISEVHGRVNKTIRIAVKRKTRRSMAKASAKREWQRRHSEGAVA